jgi:UDP-N-acetylglucosamine 2-epimerase (non-hydrolysing)
MGPVVRALREQSGLDPIVLVTGQHRQQLDTMLENFEVQVDADLDVMTDRQSLVELVGKIVPAAGKVIRDLAPEYVLVHGDTVTTFAVALASYFEGIPVAHVEAGLRSHDLTQPFPEEANRRLTDVLTDLDFPPTPLARDNLLSEGKPRESMIVTGNTAVDAIRFVAGRFASRRVIPDGAVVGITLHRRENLPILPELAGVLAQVALAYPDVTFIYPVHLNPLVREAVWPALSCISNVILDDPWDYPSFISLLQASKLFITDSGGIQEEGAALGVPVVVLRNVTERPEGVDTGALRLAGNNPMQVRDLLLRLIGDERALLAMRGSSNPYGDGRAASRVAQAVAWRLGEAERPEDWLPED